MLCNAARSVPLCAALAARQDGSIAGVGSDQSRRPSVQLTEIAARNYVSRVNHHASRLQMNG